ncbi:MAG: hypothetical protein KQ78_01953 [Candidatus Izimaplasma bacterium HR2]|nr:MAG: hypothetical protein KQ78_01953 [Candidatus Izimaplasma bacterium HR2]
MNKQVGTLPNGFTVIIDETSDRRNLRMFKVATEKRIRQEKARLERIRLRKLAKEEAKLAKE